MDLSHYVENLHRELMVVADAGGEESRAIAERLVSPLDSATRLMLMEALSTAASEITRDLAPGSVDVRLRGRDPEFVVTPPPAEQTFEAPQPQTVPSDTTEESGTWRTTLRLPERLKPQIEEAASREGISVNAWHVRAATAALDPASPGRPTPGSSGKSDGQSFTGWVR